MAGEVGVELRGGSRGDEVFDAGIDGGQLPFQLAVLPQVEFLVIVLGQGERADGQDGRFDGVLPLGSHAIAAGDSELLLLVVVVEDDALILPAAGAFARIGTLPEFVEQLLERDLFRIVIDLERLGVVAEVVVGGVSLCTAREADAGADDAGQTPKLGVRRPESAEGKGGRLQLGGHGGIDRRLGLVALGRLVVSVQGEQERRSQDGNGAEQSLHGNLQSDPNVARQLYLAAGHRQRQSWRLNAASGTWATRRFRNSIDARRISAAPR